MGTAWHVGVSASRGEGASAEASPELKGSACALMQQSFDAFQKHQQLRAPTLGSLSDLSHGH